MADGYAPFTGRDDTPLRPGSPSLVDVVTTANLVAVAHAINTSGKFEGRQAFNSTTNKPVWAVGSAAGDVWVDATGATAHTPA